MKLQCVLFVFVQRGLQQVEGVHQPRGKTALFSWRPSELRPLLQVAVQVKLLLGLFTDELSLSGTRTPSPFSYTQKKKKQSTTVWIQRKSHAASYLTDEPGDEQKDQYAVVVSTVAEEGLWHEGGEQGHLSVWLGHFHFPQLHLNGLETHKLLVSEKKITLVLKV